MKTKLKFNQITIFCWDLFHSTISLEKILGGEDCDYANILLRGMTTGERKFKRPSL